MISATHLNAMLCDDVSKSELLSFTSTTASAENFSLSLRGKEVLRLVASFHSKLIRESRHLNHEINSCRSMVAVQHAGGISGRLYC